MAMIDIRNKSGVTTVTLNRPDKLNTFSGTMREDLLKVLDAVAADEDCRVVVLTGTGRAFSAGGDIATMASLQAAGDREGFSDLLHAGAEIVTRLRSLPQPAVASINGVAAGAGCNLALACDYRIASADASMGQTFIRIALHPDWGGTYFLPRLVGTSRAAELMMTGRMVGAAEALSIGMVDEVVPAESLAEATEAFAARIAEAPPMIVRAIKQSIRATWNHELDQQLALEMEQQQAAFLSGDAGEGMRAFLEKRKPDFRGR